MAFYSSEGLKAIALLLDELIDKQKLFSQNALAEAVGVAPNTIKGIRSNRFNTEGKITYKPDPETILELALHISEPKTSKSFDAERLLAIARGQLQLSTPDPSVQSPIAHSQAVSFLQSEMKKQGKEIEVFATDCSIPVVKMREILAGRMPTWGELLKLGGCLFPDKNPAQLAALYGVEEETPLVRDGSAAPDEG